MEAKYFKIQFWCFLGVRSTGGEYTIAGSPFRNQRELLIDDFAAAKFRKKWDENCYLTYEARISYSETDDFTWSKLLNFKLPHVKLKGAEVTLSSLEQLCDKLTSISENTYTLFDEVWRDAYESLGLDYVFVKSFEDLL